jgi:hypothetical protein
MTNIAKEIFNGEFMDAKRGIHETLVYKLSERIADISRDYAKEWFNEESESKEKKKGCNLKKINKLKAGEAVRMDQEIDGAS